MCGVFSPTTGTSEAHTGAQMVFGYIHTSLETFEIFSHAPIDCVCIPFVVAIVVTTLLLVSGVYTCSANLTEAHTPDSVWYNLGRLITSYPSKATQSEA